MIDSSDSEIDEDFPARSFAVNEQESKRKLPVKTESGQVIKGAVEKRARRVEPVDEEEQEEVHFDDDEEEEDDDMEEIEKEEEPEEDVDVPQILQLIATLSSSILANEKNSLKPLGVTTTSDGIAVAPEKTSLEKLLSFCTSSLFEIQKSALLSLLAVFQDILPHEKVRELTSKELSAKTTKEVRLQRATEKSMLQGYRLYLAILFDKVKKAPWEMGGRMLLKAKKKKKNKKLETISPQQARISMYCLCCLLESRPNFNFYEEILKCVLPRTSSPDPKISQICNNGIARCIQENSNILDCVLLIVRQLGKLYEKKSNLSPKVFEGFFSLKLDMDLKDEKRMDLIQKAKKQRRDKKRKLGIDVHKLIEETDVTAVKNHEKFQRQVEIIRELFTLYLRILNDASEDEKKLKRELTVQALKGASKIVNLVNIEFVHGILKILSTFFRDSSNIHLDVALQTCETGLVSMAVLSRPELRTKTTASEETWFGQLLVRCLTEISNELHINSTLKCIQLLFFKRRETDIRIVSDFCLRLLSASLTTPAHVTISLLSICRNILEKYPSAKDMVLGSNNNNGKVIEEEVCAPLIPISFGLENELSNNQYEARLGWELSILSERHYHIGVKKYSTETRLAKVAFNEKPLELLSQYHPLDGKLFFPGVPDNRPKNKKPITEKSNKNNKKNTKKTKN